MNSSLHSIFVVEDKLTGEPARKQGVIQIRNPSV